MIKTNMLGQGDGDSQVGDVVARDGSGGQKQRDQEKGKGQEIKQEKIIMKQKFHYGIEEALFKELELPNLKRKEQDENWIENIEFNDIRKTGLMGNIDKKRTMMSAFKRNAMSGKACFSSNL